MELKNYLLISLVNWLSIQMLHGSQSRQRTRFIGLLTDRVAELDKERLILCEKYAAKKDGKTVYFDKDNKETTDKSLMVKYKIDDMEKFNKEYADYMNEDLVLDITPATKEIIYTVREIVLNTKQEFSGQEAMLYNQYAEAFEKIKVKLGDIVK